MASLADWLLEFVEDTIVCLSSGCLATLAVVLLAYAIIFLVSSGLPKFFRRKSDDNQIEKPIANDSRECTAEGIKVASDNFESSSSVLGERNNKVRQYLEQLIGSLVRANLNDVPLTPVSNDVQYEIFVEKYQPRLSSKLTALSTSLLSDKDSESLDESVRPSTLYNDLRSLIRDIRDAAALLPPLSAYDENEYGSTSMEERLRDKNYEEILSIAVLNEIISKSQNGKDSPSSSTDEHDFTRINKVLNLSSPEFDCYDVDNRLPGSSTKHFYSVERRIEEIISTERRLVSSEGENDAINNDDDVVESPIEYSITRCNLMEKHRAHFPELGKDVIDGYNSYDEDNVTEMVNSVDSWEDNWLFRRKKRSRIKNSVSVPMLVPNPSQTYRALIGGVDVDDTSDLSECSTDSITEEPLSHSFVSTHEDFSDASRTEYIYNYHFACHADMANVAMVAATETENNDAISDRDRDSSGITSISRDTCTISDICSGEDHLSSFERDADDECLSQWWDDIAEAKSDKTKTKDFLAAQEDSGEGSLETESEPEQKLDADQSSQSPILSVSEPSAPTDVNVNNKIHDKCDEQPREDATCTINPTVEQDLATPPKPGTIAEREHLKWQQAAPIANNPYSKESIEKRNLDTLLPKNRHYEANGVSSIPTTPSSFVDTTTGEEFEVWCDRDQELSQSTASLSSLGGSSVSESKYERDYYVNMNGERHKPITNQSEHSGMNGEGKTEGKGADEKVSDSNATSRNREGTPVGRGTNLVRVSSWCDRKQAKSTVETKVSERLPSVKELAKQFSSESTPTTIRRSIQPASNRRPLHDQVHSLTARSMSREFREGLKHNATKAFNRNVQISLIGDAYRPAVPSESNGTKAYSKLDANHDGVDEVFPLRNGKIVSSVDMGNV